MAVGGQWIYNDYRYRGINTGYHGSSSSNVSDYSMWGLVASAVLGAVSAAVNLYSTYKNNQVASKQYSQQYALQKDALYNGHQIETADMAKAGLNPILSGSGASTSQVSTASNTTASSTDLLGPLLNAYQQHQNLKFSKEQFSFDKEVRGQELELEKKKTKADILKSLSQTNLTNAQIEQVLENLGLIKAQKEGVQASTENTRADTAVKQKSLEQLNEQIKSLHLQNAGAVTDNQIKEVQKAMMESQLTFDEFERRFWQMAGIPQSAASTLAGSNVGAGVLSGVLTIAGLANKAEADNIADGLAAKTELEKLKKKISPLENAKHTLSSSEQEALNSLKAQRSLLLQKVEKAKKSWNTRQSHFKTGSDL